MKLPFTPAVYENAARFTGRSPGEVSRDPELLYAGHRAAYLEYHHRQIAVGIDIYTPSFLVSNPETDQRAFVEAVSRTHPHVKVRVNMNSGIVTCSDPERIYREVDRILEFAGGRPNCLLGTGALPYETPPENVRLIREYVS